MKKNLNLKKQVIAMVLTLVLALSLVACGGGDDSSSGPEGSYKNTLIDEDDGEGFKAVDEFGGLGELIFNPDGTGEWNYALETVIEWKLKGDTLTIVEKWEDSEFGEQEETYKASWDGEKIIVDSWGFKYLFEKADSSSPKEDTEDADLAEDTGQAMDAAASDLVGDYECTGSDMQGTELPPSGEWLKLNDDASGAWFLGVTEDTFTWTLEANKINFAVDVANSDTKMEYSASLDGDEIILDTGMLYYFVKEGSVSADDSAADMPEETTLAPAPAEDNVATGYVGWGYKTQGKLTIPRDWYGVLQLRDCEGFPFEEKDYDVWGYTRENSSGQAYFELWLNPDQEGDPVLSFYIDKEETEWLTPIITDGDAYVDLDGGTSDSWQTLTEDHEWALMSQYIDGALDIYHGYYDDEGRYADCRFFVREKGIGWHEDSDPLPPGYDEYKAEHAHIVED